MTQKPASSIVSDLPRLLLVAVVLPVVIVCIDQAAVEIGKSVFPLRALLPVLFVAQVGLLAACAGRFIANVWLRCLVLAWSLALVDLVAIAAMFYGGGDDAQCMMFALISGQIGLVTVWGIMSRIAWQVRIPVFAGALLLLVIMLMRKKGANVWRSEAEVWAVILAMQSAAVVGICALLRLRGYRLLQTASDAGSSAAAEREPFQFSIKHIIFWTTAICPILVLARGVDWFLLESQDRFHAVELGLAMALVSWVATLCALGSSPRVVRLLLLSILPPLIGCLLMWVTSRWVVSWGLSRLSWMFMMFRDFHAGWIAWCALAAWFLAAQLLVFRAAGYTIARSKRR